MPKENASARRLIHDPNLDPDAYFIEFPLEDDFEDQDTEYFVSGPDQWPAAKEVGEALIRGAVPSLKSARIGFMWKRRGGNRNNKAILGKAVLANPLVRVFCNYRGFVVLSADHVRACKLNRWQLEALIFHELQHFVVDEEGSLMTVGHDFEAFAAEVSRYGLWKPDLKIAKDAFEQMPLF